MDCFMNENTELARRVLASDDQVDACDERLCAAMVENARGSFLRASGAEFRDDRA